MVAAGRLPCASTAGPPPCGRAPAHCPSPLRSHLIGYDTVGVGRGADSFHPGHLIGYFTGGVDRGAGLSAPGHVIGYVTVDGPGFGNRSVPGEPVPAVPEFAKTTTTATIPNAIAVCRLVPADARQ